VASRSMAIVKTNYVKKGKGERGRAKANIRYMEHRRGKDGQKMSRTLFSVQGAIGRYAAYRMIDEAEKGRYFYRIVLSPDPLIEDTKQDLYLREITKSLFSALEERGDAPLAWVAVVHADHTDIRHVHALAVVPGKLTKEDLQLLRQTATQAALAQRRTFDLIQEHQREREGAQWEQAG
jgi:hypothetical protein